MKTNEKKVALVFVGKDGVKETEKLFTEQQAERLLARSKGRPWGWKKVEKPAEKPAEKPTEKPAEKPAEKV